MIKSAFQWVICAGLIASCGCKKQSPTPSSGSLEKTFSSAPEPVKEAVHGVDGNLKQGNYPAALGNLAKAATSPDLNEAQRRAIGAALAQLSDLAATNPAFNTPENTRMRQRILASLNEKR